jgi:hypothetical protein
MPCHARPGEAAARNGRPARQRTEDGWVPQKKAAVQGPFCGRAVLAGQCRPAPDASLWVRPGTWGRSCPNLMASKQARPHTSFDDGAPVVSWELERRRGGSIDTVPVPVIGTDSNSAFTTDFQKCNPLTTCVVSICCKESLARDIADWRPCTCPSLPNVD